MRVRQILLESPEKDNLTALLTYFDDDADKQRIQKSFQQFMDIFKQVIKPNINPANVGQYYNFWAVTGRYLTGLVNFVRMSKNGTTKFGKFLRSKLPDVDISKDTHYAVDGLSGTYVRAIKTSMMHYYNNTPYNEIKNWLPDKFTSLQDFTLELAEIEYRLKKQNTELIKHDSDETQKGITPIDLPVELPNGMMWFNLNKSYCNREGDAMGHCGNRASYTESDTVLSLREPKGQNVWRPVCTFILDTSSGLLGEMKGRANEKPAERYHPAILALLRYADFIRGIEDKGYMPEENFNLIEDVPDDDPTKQWLKKNKLEMFGQDIGYMLKIADETNQLDSMRLIIQSKFGFSRQVNVDTKNKIVTIFNGENIADLANDLALDSMFINTYAEYFEELIVDNENFNDVKSQIKDYLQNEIDDEKQTLDKFDELADYYIDGVVAKWARSEAESLMEDSIDRLMRELYSLRMSTKPKLSIYVQFDDIKRLIDDVEDDEDYDSLDVSEKISDGFVAITRNELTDYYADPDRIPNMVRIKDFEKMLDRTLGESTLIRVKQLAGIT